MKNTTEKKMKRRFLDAKKKSVSNHVRYSPNADYLRAKEIFKCICKNIDKQYMNLTIAETTHILNYLVYHSQTLSISTPLGVFNFCSRAKSIDVTRVIISSNMRGKGAGSLMMKMLLSVLYFVKRENEVNGLEAPSIVLECCGEVGAFDNRHTTPVEKQVSFFKKFGFEIVRYKDDYTHMKLDWNSFEAKCPHIVEEYYKMTSEILVD